MEVTRTQAIANYMEIRKNPCTELEPEETAKLAGSMQVIREKMRERTHFYQKELVQNAFIGFLLDLGNIMLSKKDRLIRPTLSRKEELFEQFLQLLFEHCKEQHVVTFYAEKLFITPQYLSLILKELTGKSANKWIDDALIVEAKILLKAPQATVQQVADILHFSDQSTFGKFFKKHIGISPMEYRKILKQVVLVFLLSFTELIPVDQFGNTTNQTAIRKSQMCWRLLRWVSEDRSPVIKIRDGMI